MEEEGIKDQEFIPSYWYRAVRKEISLEFTLEIQMRSLPYLSLKMMVAQL
jgi:hypothetical protein